MNANTRKVFLFGFNPQSLSRDRVTTFFDQNPNFLNWITILPGQLFFVADLTARDVTLIIRERFPDQILFVTEVSQLSSDGWLPQDIWNFINNPSSAKVGNFIEALSKRPFGN
jgi:hypothetical protein